MQDIRDDIFRCVAKRSITAVIIADDEGIVAETGLAAETARELGLTVRRILAEGEAVKPGSEIARIVGSPKCIAMGEDRLIGIMAKPSGIATMAQRFVEKAGRRPRIVSGAWKKMPQSQKEFTRRALAVGGVDCHISNKPFLYLDKNYVRILGGGIKACLEAVSGFKGYMWVIQVKGTYNDIAEEACQAARNGANIVFIDSGRQSDLGRVSEALNQAGLRGRVEIAFGGHVRLDDVAALKASDVDILDIGRQIMDAPLLDMRMEVVEV